MFYKCGVDNCASKRQDVQLHQLPESEERLQQWLKCINSDRLRNSTPRELRNEFVCHKHFERRFIKDNNRIRLKGYPSLFSEEEIRSGISRNTLEAIRISNVMFDHCYTRHRSHEDHTYTKARHVEPTGIAPEQAPVVQDVPIAPEQPTTSVKEEAVSNEEAEHAQEWSVSEAALSELYADHVVKDELVLGPVDIHRPSMAGTQGTTSALSLHTKKLVLRECSVQLERLPGLAGPPTHTEATSPQGPRHNAAPPTRRLRHIEATPRRDPCHNRRKLTTESPQDGAILSYACDICGKIFQRKCQLMQHIQCHNNKKSGKTKSMSGGRIRVKTTVQRVETTTKRVRTATNPVQTTTKHVLTTKNCVQTSTKRVQTTTERVETTTRSVKTTTELHSRDLRRRKFPKKVDICDSARLEINTKKKSYSCEICTAKFNEMEQLKIHTALHTGGIIYSCEVCEKKFVHRINFERHRRVHTGEKPFSCDICNKRFNDKGHLKTHIRFHTGYRPYSCDICSKKFTQAAHLNTHKRVHTGEKKYSCKVCKQHFTNASTVNRHQRMHSGVKPYMCDICNMQFFELANLNMHKRVHTGEKPFCCEVCKKRFRLRSTLYVHKKIHTAEKPYNCEICKRSFRHLSNCKTHKIVHSGEKRFSCEICGRRFPDQGSVTKHRRTHSGDKPFSCEICQKKFKLSGYLSKHRKTHTTRTELTRNSGKGSKRRGICNV